MGKPCAQCGNELGEGARVCSRCGALVPQVPTAAQTMMGFTSPLAPPTRPNPQTPAPTPAAQPPPMAQTMLGFSAPDLRAPVKAAPAPSAASAPRPSAAAPMSLGAKTMLGIAPGIAPLPSTAPTPALAPTPAPASPSRPSASLGGTMLGVAMPGIAPAHSQPGASPPAASTAPAGPAVAAPVGSRTMLLEPTPPIVPAPAPLVREAAPTAPIVVGARRGAPLAAVAVVASLLVLCGGAAILYFSHGAPPMTATAKVSTTGKEQLHLQCPGCPDGTKASWRGATTSFTGHAADLDLPAPLTIGDNRFDIALDRPGVGRDETVKLVLPLAYRIGGDLSGIGATPPVVRVDVEAQRGESVTVDGKPVTLDASGKATLSYDVTADTAGASDETRTLERKIPYEVVGPHHAKSRGDVAVRVAVLPLHVDAPSASLVTEGPAIWVAGKTAKGASVTVNGKPIATAPDGSFAGQVDVTDGEQPVVVRTAPAPDAATKVAPRTATIPIQRVASLADEAKSLAKAATVEPSALARDPVAAAGKPVTIVGNVVDVRTTNHRTALLVDDKRACAAGPCLIRVDCGADLDVRAGDAVSAYGVVAAKPITTPDGKTLPTVDASLVTKSVKR